MKISVVIPCYNEEKNIKKTVTAYCKYLKDSLYDYEIIVVNDGSTDKTSRVLSSLEDIITVSYTKNQGKGYAVKRGVLRATGDYIFFTDADMSYSPSVIQDTLSLITQEKSLGAVGIRYNLKVDYPIVRRIFSECFNFIVKNALHMNFADTQCGFKCFEKRTAKLLFSKLNIYDFGFDMEILFLANCAGISLSRIPVSFIHQKSSSVNPLSDSLRMLGDLLKIRRRKDIRNDKYKS